MRTSNVTPLLLMLLLSACSANRLARQNQVACKTEALLFFKGLTNSKTEKIYTASTTFLSEVSNPSANIHQCLYTIDTTDLFSNIGRPSQTQNNSLLYYINNQCINKNINNTYCQYIEIKLNPNGKLETIKQKTITSD